MPFVLLALSHHRPQETLSRQVGKGTQLSLMTIKVICDVHSQHMHSIIQSATALCSSKSCPEQCHTMLLFDKGKWKRLQH